jgi:ATP-dependent Clp protease ATP-binding subunit ClpA
MIQKHIEDEMTEQFFLGRFQPGCSITVDAVDGTIVFQ